MPIKVKVTGPAPEDGLFEAVGLVTDAAGKKRGTAKVVVAAGEPGTVQLAISATSPSVILDHQVVSYQGRYTSPIDGELKKGAKIEFSRVTFAKA